MADVISDWDLSFIRDPIPDDSALQIPARYLRGLLARLDAAEKVCEHAEKCYVNTGLPPIGDLLTPWHQSRGID